MLSIEEILSSSADVDVDIRRSNLVPRGKVLGPHSVAFNFASLQGMQGPCGSLGSGKQPTFSQIVLL